MSLLVMLLVGTAQAEELVDQAAIDVPLTVGTGAIWAGLYLGKDRQRAASDQPTDIAAPSGLDSLARTTVDDSAELVSDLVLYGTIAGTLIATPLQGRDDPLGRTLLYAEAFMVNGAITELTKHAVDRPRPYSLDGVGEADVEHSLSFFSGHTSIVAATSFTFARSVDLTSEASGGSLWLLYGGATVLTASAATMRVQGGFHYPSDVLVGAAVGASIGWLVPELHRQSRVRLALGADRVQLVGVW